MGEIGAMMARLEQEGLNIEELINYELEAAGFLSLAARSTDSLSDRIDAISGNQSELKCLFKSIEDQLRMVQEEENIPESLLDDKMFVDNDAGVKHVIVIDDDDDIPKSDFNGQVDLEPSPSHVKTQSQPLSKPTETTNSSQPTKPADKIVTSVQSSKTSTTTAKTTTPAISSPAPLRNSEATQLSSKPEDIPQYKRPDTLKTTPVSTAQDTPHNTPLNTPIDTPESVIAYRTLRSPSDDGPDKAIVSITVKSSQPIIPPQNLRGAAVPTTPSIDAEPAAQASNNTAPKFDEGTRIIGKRSDDLWYPGQIIKVITDRYNQNKFRVKFDQGNRGLLRSNHVALETSAPRDVLNIGSRVVGPYGKLDVLYAGIVAEKCCPETRNRFLIFFDDGFAQYLPLQKLHHVCNTGDKVWNEVAEHSQEFIQEYLEEFPNRPMVVLKVNQWVKTEWRGKWLKAKVLQVDCSLVKMLFQVDNRTEWIYRGSTRLEPLFKALIDGKISKKKSSKRPKKQSQAPDEPYVDFSVTNPAFGFSPYSKTDSKGPQQQPQQKDTTSAGQPSSSTQTETSQPSSSKTQEPTSTVTTSTTTTTQTTTTQIPLTPTSKSSTQQPSNSVSSNQTSATSTTPSLAPSQAPSSNTLAVRTLRRLANKVNDGNISPSKTTDSVKKTPPELKTNRIVSPSANTDSYFFPNSAVNTSYTTNIRSNNILPNHISPVNHMSGVNHLDDSNASIIASTMRKRTTAGLNTVNIGHVLSIGPDVIIPGHHNGITPSLGKSPKKKWEAPWKTHSDTNILKEPNMKVKEQNSKHDAATLIQERLQAEKKLVKTLKTMPELQSLVPKFPVLGPHQCAKPCGKVETISKKEQSKHNMLALPLLLNWKREIAKRHPRIKREIYYRAPCNKRLKSIEDVAKYLLLTGTSNVAIDQFSFDPDIACTDVMVHSESIVIPDISLGEESVPISVMNEHDKSLPPSIDYVHDRILSDGVHINTDPGFLACCDCTDNCQDKTKCSCAQLTISASAAVDGKVDNTVGYEYRRLMDTVPTGIYECNQNCACSSQCFNRVVQNGIQLRLQVFKTENRGWGLRTLDDIPVGTFICTYSGQIMNEDMANKEGRDFGDEYLAELDHIEVVEKIKEGYESSVSDQEDDSVILKTLQTGHSTSDLSENGSPCGSFTSDSDSDDSDSSHSSYSPRVKKNGHSKRKSPEPVKITEEDGTTFSITMADEKCVMAISSGDSIVLKRIGGPDDVKQENNTVKPKEEASNKIDLQKDPPPMPKPTIIDLTSDDEDNCLIKCSLNETEPDRTFESKTMNKSTEEQSTKDTDSKKFTDFKFFNISSENANGGDAAVDVTKGDIRNDVKVESAEGTKGVGSSDVISSNMVIKDSETIDKKTELETAVEMLVDQNITLKEADNSSPSHVTCSVSEVTKQEEMEIDPCMREQSQELSEEKMDTTSASHVPEKQPISDSVRDNDRQDFKDGIKDKPSLQGNSCLSDGGSNQDKNCGENSCLENEDSLQTSNISIQGSENDKAGDVNHHHSDEKDYYGNRNSDNHDNNKNDTLIEDDKFKDGNLGNVNSCQPDDVTDSIHGNKESIATKESQEEHGVDNDCGVDFELRMEIDESMDSIDGKESDTQSDRLSGKSFNFSKTPAPSDDDSVPPLMSADDLSKIAAQIHLADEEPPKLTKMQPGSRLTGDLHDTIAKLQSRGVALNNTGPDVPEEDSTQSFDDLPLFPSTSSCDSFPASPASSHSGSWVSDSVDRSSDGSCEQKARRDRLKNDGRRARRFIVTLQKSGVKRSASPDGIEGGPQKRPSTRSLFNGEEHCYVIDAKAYGNCGRYLNHSCSPNLFVQNVFIDTHDLRFPRVAFFAQHNIRAGCELTWDYMYEVGSVQDKFLRCYCGSSQCRGRLL